MRRLHSGTVYVHDVERYTTRCWKRVVVKELKKMLKTGIGITSLHANLTTTKIIHLHRHVSHLIQTMDAKACIAYLVALDADWLNHCDCIVTS